MASRKNVKTTMMEVKNPTNKPVQPADLGQSVHEIVDLSVDTNSHFDASALGGLPSACRRLSANKATIVASSRTPVIPNLVTLAESRLSDPLATVNKDTCIVAPNAADEIEDTEADPPDDTIAHFKKTYESFNALLEGRVNDKSPEDLGKMVAQALYEPYRQGLTLNRLNKRKLKKMVKIIAELPSTLHGVDEIKAFQRGLRREMDRLEYEPEHRCLSLNGKSLSNPLQREGLCSELSRVSPDYVTLLCAATDLLKGYKPLPLRHDAVQILASGSVSAARKLADELDRMNATPKERIEVLLIDAGQTSAIAAAAENPHLIPYFLQILGDHAYTKSEIRKVFQTEHAVQKAGHPISDALHSRLDSVQFQNLTDLMSTYNRHIPRGDLFPRYLSARQRARLSEKLTPRTTHVEEIAQLLTMSKAWLGRNGTLGSWAKHLVHSGKPTSDGQAVHCKKTTTRNAVSHHLSMAKPEGIALTAFFLNMMDRCQIDILCPDAGATDLWKNDVDQCEAALTGFCDMVSANSHKIVIEPDASRKRLADAIESLKYYTVWGFNLWERTAFKAFAEKRPEAVKRLDATVAQLRIPTDS